MLVFPQWRPELSGSRNIIRPQRWMDAERLAPYLARPMLPPLPPQNEDEDSIGESSPERALDGGVENKDGVCEWRGCSARFPNVARLSAHVARVHALAHRDGLFYCGWKTCSRPQRGFNARYKMLVHVRTHTNERPHTCNQCNKSFSRAENLKIHVRSHSGEKPYICPYEGCGKAYSNSSDRFKHTRTHTVDKPYFCKVVGCNKRYTDPSSLRKHVKTYKHFTPEKEIPRKELEDEKIIERISPQSEKPTYIDGPSPLHTGIYNSPKSIPSPKISSFEPVVPLTDTPMSPPYTYIPVLDQVNYMRPLEPVYPVRVPSNELSYLEYTHMYDHAYRSYYLNRINYPVLRPSITEKVYTYEDQTQLNYVTVDHSGKSPVKVVRSVPEEVPLNLICTRHMECKPVDDLVKITDVPLDLSTRS